MDLYHQDRVCPRQTFNWGEIIWLKEPDQGAMGGMSVARVTIYPFCQQEVHQHLSEEQLFIVDRGSGTFVIDGKPEAISVGKMLYIKPFSQHGVENNSEEPLEFTVVYSPLQLEVAFQEPIVIEGVSIKDILPQVQIDMVLDAVSQLTGLRVTLEDQPFEGPCYSDEGTSVATRYLYSFADQSLRMQYPILVGEDSLGYLITEPFSFEGPNSEKPSCTNNLLNPVKTVIKSRIHMVSAQLGGAIVYLVRAAISHLREQALSNSEKHLASERQEKLLLKEALKKAQMGQAFFGQFHLSFEKDEDYPFVLEGQLLNLLADKDLTEALWLERWEQVLLEHSLHPTIFKELVLALVKIGLRGLCTDEQLQMIRRQTLERIHRSGYLEVVTAFIQDYFHLLNQSKVGSWIEGVNAYIKAHYNETLTLQHLAEVFFVSPNYLSSQFNKYNGSSLSDFIQRVRIDQAKLLLTQGDSKVSAIAHQVGYASESYFVKAFKKHVGCLPSQWKRNQIR